MLIILLCLYLYAHESEQRLEKHLQVISRVILPASGDTQTSPRQILSSLRPGFAGLLSPLSGQ